MSAPSLTRPRNRGAGGNNWTTGPTKQAETTSDRAQRLAPFSRFDFRPSLGLLFLTSGNSGKTYRLTVGDDCLTCSCPARGHCWHLDAAAVWLAKWEEAKAQRIYFGWLTRDEFGVGADFEVVLNLARVLPSVELEPEADDFHVFRTREQLDAFIVGWRVDRVVANGEVVNLK